MKILRGGLFDVFGTVCDWCGPMADEIAALSRQYDEKLDAFQFARDWRNEYALQTSRRGIESLPWVPLTDLTRSALEELLRIDSDVPLKQQTLIGLILFGDALGPGPTPFEA
ncbi:MAG: hypothetical protein CM1200mP24_09260 [Gammaproteobacteria bacterium]|nr:MAG: hypothetical protein CM1200mP24_09260 [Gammaproteobacteria bacterium]